MQLKVLEALVTEIERFLTTLNQQGGTLRGEVMNQEQLRLDATIRVAKEVLAHGPKQ